MLNTTPSTFRLRFEVAWFLQAENTSKLIFIDDLDLNELYEQKKLEIVLVDHHSLRSKLNGAVTEIIDHHHVQKDAIALKEYEPRSCFIAHLTVLLLFCSSSAIKIEYVGSCCTLIAERILSSTAKFPVTREIADLLTGRRIGNETKIIRR